MKKVSPSFRLAQARKQLKRHKKLRRNLVKLRRRALRTARRTPSFTEPKRTLTLVAPENFNLTRGDGKRVEELLRDVEQVVLGRCQPVRIDFRNAKRIYVPGALILFAGLNRVIRLSKLDNPIRILPPIAIRARQVMKQIGLFDLCGASVAIKPTRDDVVYWRLATGATQSGDELQIIDAIAERVNVSDAQNVQASGLWRGVSEAVNNAHEHGYKLPRADGFTGLESRRWWLLTQIRDQTFTAAVCDLGCGYAATLEPEILEWFGGLVPRLRSLENSDTQAIQAAMEYGRSSTRKTERGRGSRDALALLERHGEGDLYVLSNRGYVRYSCKRQKVEVKTIAPLDFSVRGTIIWWNLRLRSAP